MPRMYCSAGRIFILVGMSVSVGACSSDGPCSLPELPGIRICCGQSGDNAGTCVPLSTAEYYLANCVTEGVSFDLKEMSAGEHCCSGLFVSPLSFPVDGGQDEQGDGGTCTTAPVGSGVCLPCGDGVCESPEESSCDCPADCS